MEHWPFTFSGFKFCLCCYLYHCLYWTAPNPPTPHVYSGQISGDADYHLLGNYFLCALSQLPFLISCQDTATLLIFARFNSILIILILDNLVQKISTHYNTMRCSPLVGTRGAFTNDVQSLRRPQVFKICLFTNSIQ